MEKAKTSLRLRDFDYHLPKKLIAQEPVKPRDHSRLLVLRKPAEGARPPRNSPAYRLEHRHFYDLADYLRPGDVLVLNDSRVFPARLIGRRQGTGGRVEVFLLKKITRKKTSPVSQSVRKTPARQGGSEVWQCLVGGPRRKTGLTVEFPQGLAGKIARDNGDGTWDVIFNKVGSALMRAVERIGSTPLPPYIKRRGADGRQKKSDLKNYQTIYADKTGSVAAPTAGLHFTPALLRKLKQRSVRIEYVTLHVGLGTFAPVKAEEIAKHKMHAEHVLIDKEVMHKIFAAKKKGGRIIAVGTTSARSLEAMFKNIDTRNYLKIKNFNRWVDIFIYPGYEFKVVDALVTNFHLPKSTLLMLVSAFAGMKNIENAYREAIRRGYRFYSYGDAMLII